STPPLTPDVAAQEAGFGLDTSGVPDFLAGPDAIGPDEPLAAKPAAPQRPATPEEVSARASQLLDGELGDWIQELAAEIGAADVTAISRAFAAGYLAARMQGEN
ncbi:MAG TPA: hypothetical protein VLC48_00295, partial [Gemmatimonadota bacterium]|nr:hypothetical protein [Gemmatimonadota bacterium]